MRELYAIVAADSKGGIGVDGRLPWKRKDDLEYFKKQTYGGTVIMGRKTYESIGKPLHGRKTVVLTRGHIDEENVVSVNNVKEALQQIEGRGWIIGGAEIYELFEPFVSKIFYTHIMGNYDADVKFPIDLLHWERETTNPGEGCTFSVYKRREKVIVNVTPLVLAEDPTRPVAYRLVTMVVWGIEIPLAIDDLTPLKFEYFKDAHPEILFNVKELS